MIMILKAGESGMIRHNMSPGSIIAAGDLIVSLTLKDPSATKPITNFKGRLQFIPQQPEMTKEEAKEIIGLSYYTRLRSFLRSNHFDLFLFC